MALNKKGRRLNHNPGLLLHHTHLTTRNRGARLNKGARTKDVFFEDEMDNELDVEIERLTAFNYIDDVLPRFADSSISSRSDYSEE